MNEEDFMQAQLLNQQQQVSQMGLQTMVQPPSMDANIANMRWNGDEITYQIAKSIGGYELKVNDDGTHTFYRPEGSPPPLMNDRGIRAVIHHLQTRINPFTGLTNLAEEDANEIARQDWLMFDEHLANNAETYDLDTTNLGIVSGDVNRLVFMQIRRAVNGFEANNFHTQSMEQNVRHQGQLGAARGFSIPFLGFGKRGN